MKIEPMSKLAHGGVIGLVATFFVSYFILGLEIHKDYGIHWDHDHNKHYGEVTYQVYKEVINGELEPSSAGNEFSQIHGPAFELLLNVLERNSTGGDSRDRAFVRHLATFVLFFVAALFFCLLCKAHFYSWKMGVLGGLMLVISPRIFAHSFYNSIDIACMSFFIISMYTMTSYLDNKTLSRAVFHALACAILIAIRNFGVFVFLLTLFFVALEYFDNRRSKNYYRTLLTTLSLYIGLLVIFTVLLWPYLWADPLTRFVESFGATADTQWGGTNLYLGEFVRADQLPWHYNFVWILITTPLLYVAVFFLGLFRSVGEIVSDKFTFSMKRNNLLFILWLAVPLAAPAILKSTLFDGWRHHYFVYPAFLLITLSGVRSLALYLWRHREKNVLKVVGILLVFLAVANLVHVTSFMLRNHPYQNVYFNFLAGKNIKSKFELDYWGLSYREGLQYILDNDPATNIKISVDDNSGIAAQQILEPLDRQRLNYVGVDEAKYFLTTFRYRQEEFSYENEFYSVIVDDEKIMSVYKLK